MVYGIKHLEIIGIIGPGETGEELLSPLIRDSSSPCPQLQMVELLCTMDISTGALVHLYKGRELVLYLT